MRRWRVIRVGGSLALEYLRTLLLPPPSMGSDDGDHGRVVTGDGVDGVRIEVGVAVDVMCNARGGAAKMVNGCIDVTQVETLAAWGVATHPRGAFSIIIRYHPDAPIWAVCLCVLVRCVI